MATATSTTSRVNGTTASSSLSTISQSVHSITTSTTVTTSSTTTSDTPFFPYPSTLVPPPEDDETNQPKSHNITKLVLVCLFLVGGCIFFTAVMIWRCRRLRRRNRPGARRFFSIRTSSPAPSSTHSTTLSRSTTLFASSIPRSGPGATTQIVLDDPFLYPSPYPSHLLYLPRTADVPQVRAMDTDEGGRRMGDAGSTCSDEGDKEVLPAYDNVGGPPRYDDE